MRFGKPRRPRFSLAALMLVVLAAGVLARLLPVPRFLTPDPPDTYIDDGLRSFMKAHTEPGFDDRAYDHRLVVSWKIRHGHALTEEDSLWMSYCFINEKVKNKLKSTAALRLYLEHHPELLDEVPAGAFDRPPPSPTQSRGPYYVWRLGFIVDRGDGVPIAYEEYLRIQAGGATYRPPTPAPRPDPPRPTPGPGSESPAATPAERTP